MNDVIIAVIGSLTTILTAIITGLFAKKEIEKSERNITEQERVELSGNRKGFLWKIFALVTFFVGIIIAVAFISMEKRWKEEDALSLVIKKYKEDILKGLKKTEGNPYVIPSVMMDIELEKITNPTSHISHLEASYTIAYNTVYLGTIATGKRAFDDGLRSNRGGEVVLLAGSDKQLVTAESPNSKAWNILYPAVTGDNRMTVTRFKVIYPPQLSNYSSKFFGRLMPNEEEFAYPNTSNDVIGEVVIIVSSKTLNLKLDDLHNAAVGSLDDLNPAKWVEPTLVNYDCKGSTERTVVARFPSLGNKDVAKLKIGW